MQDLWKETRAALRAQLGDEQFTARFAHFSAQTDESGQTLALITDDEVAALVMERSYREVVEQCARAVSGKPVRVRVRHRGLDAPAEAPLSPQLSLFELSAQPPLNDAGEHSAGPRPVAAAPVEPVLPSPASSAIDRAEVERRVAASGLLRGHEFEHFVVGSSNQFAWEAARAAAELPGQAYNPLFIYGGVGLGKTHLMQAVGIAAIKANPELRVRYVSAESFLNDMIGALGANRMDAFRQKHRDGVDMLLLDDIHFLEGKERTTEEFFHTFNTLVQAGKQIVVTSDRKPQEMPALEARVRSRLMMGLIADVQAPDFETRAAIVRVKARQLGFAVPDDVSQYLADAVRTNVRELHGALMRIGSFARMTSVPITLGLAREQLQRVTQEQSRRPSLDLIVRCVCEEMGVTLKELRGRKRIAAIAMPRKVAMYVARKHTETSFPELGRYFGDRDHTTVLAACQSLEELLAAANPIRSAVERIERRIAAL